MQRVAELSREQSWLKSLCDLFEVLPTLEELFRAGGSPALENAGLKGLENGESINADYMPRN